MKQLTPEHMRAAGALFAQQFVIEAAFVKATGEVIDCLLLAPGDDDQTATVGAWRGDELVTRSVPIAQLRIEAHYLPRLETIARTQRRQQRIDANRRPEQPPAVSNTAGADRTG